MWTGARLTRCVVGAIVSIGSSEDQNDEGIRMSIRNAELNVGGGTRSDYHETEVAVLVSAKGAGDGGNVRDLTPLGKIPSCRGRAPHSL